MNTMLRINLISNDKCMLIEKVPNKNLINNKMNETVIRRNEDTSDVAAKVHCSKNLVFPLFGLLNLIKNIEILVFSFEKYRCELCTCVNMEINICAKNFNTPVLITTCNMPLQMQGCARYHPHP